MECFTYTLNFVACNYAESHNSTTVLQFSASFDLIVHTHESLPKPLVVSFPHPFSSRPLESREGKGLADSIVRSISLRYHVVKLTRPRGQSMLYGAMATCAATVVSTSQVIESEES